MRSRRKGAPLIGGMESLSEMIRREEVDQVFLALPWTADERIRDIALRLSDFPVHVRLAPDLVGYQFSGSPAINLSGLSMLRLFDRPITGGDYILKRIEDLVLSSLGLLLVGPFMLLIAAIIKLETSRTRLFPSGPRRV